MSAEGRRVVTLYVREDCPLCDEAKDLLVRLAAAMRFKLTTVDVDADPALQERYGSSVPVVGLDGRVLVAAPFQEASLRTALATVLGG